MTYEDFARNVRKAGLRAQKCSEHHWQICGGPWADPVNCWPNTKRGFRFQVQGQKARTGSLSEAILASDAHGVCIPNGTCIARNTSSNVEPPWTADTRVGLIRRLWRLIW